MSFFLTSQGRGFGGNLGGVAGADAICRLRATAVGRGDRTWRAYLSSPASGDAPAVDARDRIGRGPWVNARGVHIAANVEGLHSSAVNLTKDTALTETGAEVGPTRHDILTGSNPDGSLTAGPAAGPAMPTAARWWDITTAVAAGAAIPGTPLICRAAARRPRCARRSATDCSTASPQINVGAGFSRPEGRRCTTD